MGLEKAFYALVVVVLTISSGYCDSRGFLHSSKVWNSQGKLVWGETLRSALGFAGGILLYWGALRFLPKIDVAKSTETQTIGWFITAMVGIALSTGNFFRWSVVDRVVGVAVIAGLAWLLFRGH